MSIFFPRRGGHSASTGFLRLLGLALVFILVAWAFWQNNERKLTLLKTRQAISDATGALAEEDLAHVRAVAQVLNERYGVELRLHVVTDVLKVPDVGPRTLYVGINPETRLVVLEFPALVAGALGQEFIRDLRESHFEQYWGGGNWPEGLKSALTLILERLETAHA